MGHHVLHSVCFASLALESNLGYHFLLEFSLDWMSMQINGLCLNIVHMLQTENTFNQLFTYTRLAPNSE